jgi:hypothetical protein
LEILPPVSQRSRLEARNAMSGRPSVIGADRIASAMQLRIVGAAGLNETLAVFGEGKSSDLPGLLVRPLTESVKPADAGDFVVIPEAIALLPKLILARRVGAIPTDFIRHA